jgi:hypothetical protein
VLILGLACTQAPTPATPPVSETPRVENPAPLASFERLLTGVWRQTAASGTSMFHIWRQGPGQHSLRVKTTGRGASGEPWRAIGYVYAHPRHGDLRTFGLSCWAGGVSEGTMRLVGDEGAGRSELDQQGRRRKLETRWRFTGPDRYRETLYEETRPGQIEELASWEHVREPALPASAPVLTLDELPPLVHWNALRGWIGKGWRVEDCSRPLDAPTLDARLSWIPFVDALLLEIGRVAPDGTAALLQELVLYHHAGLGKLRCFALFASGEVATGDVLVHGEREVELVLEAETATGTVARRVVLRRRKGMSLHLLVADAGAELRLEHSFQEQDEAVGR